MIKTHLQDILTYHIYNGQVSKLIITILYISSSVHMYMNTLTCVYVLEICHPKIIVFR